MREQTRRHAGRGATDTVLIARRPFTADDLALIHCAASDGLHTIYTPDAPSSPPFRDLLLAPDPQLFYNSFPFDVRPLSDDRPFFFYTVQPRDVWSFARSFNRHSADYKVNLALSSLFALVGVSAVATLVILLLPPLLLGARLPRERGVAWFLPYFLLLGAGYIIVQVGLIQKLILLLGHPTYALTVVVFSMLVSSGLGSFASRALLRRHERRLCLVPVGVAVAVSALALLIAPGQLGPRRRARLRAFARGGPAGGAGRLPDGHAVSRRPRRARSLAASCCPLGLVHERRCQRPRLGLVHLLCDLFRPPRRAVSGRRVLSRRSVRALGHGAFPPESRLSRDLFSLAARRRRLFRK